MSSVGMPVQKANVECLRQHYTPEPSSEPLLRTTIDLSSLPIPVPSLIEEVFSDLAE